MPNVDSVVADALTLQEEDRVEVARRLLEGIDSRDPHGDLGDEELLPVVVDRADQMVTGAVDGDPWPIVRADIERDLGL